MIRSVQGHCLGCVEWWKAILDRDLEVPSHGVTDGTENDTCGPEDHYSTLHRITGSIKQFHRVFLDASRNT